MKVGVGDGFVDEIFFPFLLSNGFAGDGVALLFFGANCSGTGALILFFLSDGLIVSWAITPVLYVTLSQEVEVVEGESHFWI